MNPFDPRLAAIVGLGTAIVSSHRVREVIGRGTGYAAAGAIKLGGTVLNAGRDIYDEASEVAVSRDGASRKPRSRAKVAK
jgi:hypothetical protein